MDRLPGSQVNASASAAAASAVLPSPLHSADASRNRSPASVERTGRDQAPGLGLRDADPVLVGARLPEEVGEAEELGVGRGARPEDAPGFLQRALPVPRGEQGPGEREPQLALGARIEGNELPEGVGEPGLVAPRLLDPAQRLERPPVGRVCVGEAAPEPARQLGVGALARLGDPGEGPQRGGMPGGGVDHLSVGLGGPAAVGEPLLAELREDEEEAGPLLGARLGGGQVVEDGRQLRPALELPVEPLEGGQRPGRERRVEPAGLLVEGRGLLEAPERPLEEDAEPHRHGSAGLAEPRQLLGEQRRELLVAPGGGVDPLEDGGGPSGVPGHRRLDPRQRLGVVGPAGEDAVEQLERTRRVLQPLVAQGRQLHPE